MFRFATQQLETVAGFPPACDSAATSAVTRDGRSMLYQRFQWQSDIEMRREFVEQLRQGVAERAQV